MATSGTATVNFDIAEIMEEAFERAGVEMRTGYDLKTGRRSLNLLTMEWANKGIRLWNLEQETAMTLVAGTATYTLNADTIDIFDVAHRRNFGTSNQTDVQLARTTTTTYAQIPTKLQQGQPVQYMVRRLIPPTITIWPVPDANSATFLAFWKLRRIQDVGTSVDNTMEVPFRFLPALVAGLAVHVAVKKNPERIEMLKAFYDQEMDAALQEDRERASTYLTPMIFN